ncbi:MAG: DUF4190 domain-containing protein [Anaerolineae bacterium]|nr:DUF4190 domain-containing protein [Anaerolineae bacterium]MDK1080348.1 DUF4190 domain-containing protein [Anaerolineae bacterium]MDK1118870.1 DUF4190 domain-containing protein [Anaerolineae bacterium]
MMFFQEPEQFESINRQAIISLILALMASLFFCIGFLPLPFSALICYPISVMLGIGALWTGLKAKRQIRQNDENGNVLAMIGIWVGSLTILVVICLAVLGIVLWSFATDFIQGVWRRLPFP